MEHERQREGARPYPPLTPKGLRDICGAWGPYKIPLHNVKISWTEWPPFLTRSLGTTVLAPTPPRGLLRAPGCHSSCTYLPLRQVLLPQFHISLGTCLWPHMPGYFRPAQIGPPAHQQTQPPRPQSLRKPTCTSVSNPFWHPGALRTRVFWAHSPYAPQPPLLTERWGQKVPQVPSCWAGGQAG